uniref:Uncharacterized protein n=1 Tax=Medicago truncatula TaxID=3880 RepID=I3SHQ9_MEDTR|nr:unknown [Medicago truncatula]
MLQLFLHSSLASLHSFHRFLFLDQRTVSRLIGCSMSPEPLGRRVLFFDSHDEGPYTGVADGRILKYEGEERGWTEFAVTSSNR